MDYQETSRCIYSNIENMLNNGVIPSVAFITKEAYADIPKSLLQLVDDVSVTNEETKYLRFRCYSDPTFGNVLIKEIPYDLPKDVVAILA